MRAPYCLPIISASTGEILERIARCAADYAYFEIWLDYVEDLGADFLADFTAAAAEDRLIFLLRRQGLEKPRLDSLARRAILAKLDRSRCLVDLDIFDQADELEAARGDGLRLRLIASYHNYIRTPAEADLRAVLERMAIYGPEIKKIAAFCAEPADALLLMRLGDELRQNGQKHVILGMGEHGKLTRVWGALAGAALVFAPQDSRGASAPGQLSRSQLEKILGELA